MEENTDRKEPLYKRTTLLSKFLGIILIIAFVTPFAFEFGLFDRFINLESWWIVYTLVFITSILAFLLGVVAIVSSAYQSIIELMQKYKKTKTRIKHMGLGSIAFGMVILGGFAIFYVLMIGIPVYRDLQDGVKTFMGECLVYHRARRGPDRYYLVYNYETNDELKIRISGRDYKKLAGEYYRYSLRNCKYNVKTEYTYNFIKAVEVSRSD